MNTVNADTLWAEYCAAWKRAQESLKIEDGIAAGNAWGRWLRAFESEAAVVSQPEAAQQ